MTEQSAACIPLYPAANSTGSWVLWKIETRRKGRRSNIVILVTMDAIISTMNAIAEEDAIQSRGPVQRHLEDIVYRQPTEVGDVRAKEQEQVPEETQEEDEENEEHGVVEVKEETTVVETAVEESPQQVVTRSGRLITRPSQYAMVTKLGKRRQLRS
jgi:hypothetical protein